MRITSWMIHFQIEKVTEMKEFHIKKPLYIFFCKKKEMSEFYSSVKLKVYQQKHCVRLCATLHTIQ